MQLNRSISYTQSWKATILIGLILSAVLCFVLVFLQPFDTYSTEMPYKNLKLLGYALPLFISILFIHIFENLLFKKQQKWLLWNEILIMIIGLLLISFLSFTYLNLVVNSKAIPLSRFFSWLLSFGLPFSPLVLTLWGYLRYRFSQIQLQEIQKDKDPIYTVRGENTGDVHQIAWNHFIMARAQANYVELFIRKEESQLVERLLLRSSLSNMISQLPQALQVHRSYLVNTSHLRNLKGNSRKGWCYLKGIEEAVPVSPKHFKALKIRFQSRP